MLGPLVYPVQRLRHPARLTRTNLGRVRSEIARASSERAELGQTDPCWACRILDHANEAPLRAKSNSKLPAKVGRRQPRSTNENKQGVVND